MLVLVLGLIGLILAVCWLMGVVVCLFKGVVVLFGLDWDVDDYVWSKLDDGYF